MPSPERAALARHIDDPTDGGPVLLGESPPWVFGFCVSVIAALMGSLVVAVFLFTEPDETIPIAIEASSAAAEPVIAPASGTIIDLAMDDGAKVRKGDLLLVVAAGAAERAQAPRPVRIVSPVDGVVSFPRRLGRGMVVAEFEHVVDIDRTDTLLLGAYVDAREIQRIKPGQMVLVSPPAGSGTRKIGARVVRIALCPTGSRYMLTLSTERPVYAGVRTFDMERSVKAFVVVRHRSFSERSMALLRVTS